MNWKNIFGYPGRCQVEAPIQSLQAVIKATSKTCEYGLHVFEVAIAIKSSNRTRKLGQADFVRVANGVNDFTMRRCAVRSLQETRPPRGALVVAIMPAWARMHVVAPRFKICGIAGKGGNFKQIVRPMKRTPVVFAACLFAGSAIALEAALETL